MKIAIIGSAEEKQSLRIKRLCKNIGNYLSEKDLTLLTGASLGIPGEIVKASDLKKVKVIGYSPDENIFLHNQRFDNLDSNYFSRIKYIKGFTARSLQMINDCDALILIGGRIGTLSEFTIALEEGKTLLVIKGSGGIANHLEYILSIANKEFPDQILFEKDYKKGIDKLIKLIKNKNS